MSEMNDIFHEFAACFAGRIINAKPICFREKLEAEKLDLSLESLNVVDQYLEHVFEHNAELDGDELQSTILYGGAYVGEVVRIASDDEFRWVDYKEYVVEDPEIKKFVPEPSLGTCAFIVRDGTAMFPLNKIIRFIHEGPGHSVRYFAQVCMAEKNED